MIKNQIQFLQSWECMTVAVAGNLRTLMIIIVGSFGKKEKANCTL